MPLLDFLKGGLPHVPGNCQEEAEAIRGKILGPSRILSYVSPNNTDGKAHAVVVYQEKDNWFAEDLAHGRKWLGSSLAWDNDPLDFASLLDGQAKAAGWLKF